MIRKFIMQADPKKVMIFLAAIASVLMSLAVTIVLVPVLEEYVTLKKSRYMAEQKVAAIELYGKEQIKLAADIEKAKNKIQTQVTNLPVKYLQSFLIGSLQEISWRNNVELISVTPGDAEQISQFDEISFVVNIKGGFKKMYAWLTELNESMGFVVIEDYGINLASSPVSSQGNGDLLQMNMTMTFYRYTRS